MNIESSIKFLKDSWEKPGNCNNIHMNLMIQHIKYLHIRFTINSDDCKLICIKLPHMSKYFVKYPKSIFHNDNQRGYYHNCEYYYGVAARVFMMLYH